MIMEKFNLGLAVSGARKVVTRSGLAVLNLVLTKDDKDFPLEGDIVGEGRDSFTEDGRYLSANQNHHGWDLFLMPEEVKLKTKDFELSDIEAGCKFVTRGGKEVKNLFLACEKKLFCVGGEIDEEQEWWSKGGRYTVATEENNMDLMTVIEEDQPQGIKAYIETGRIKSSDGPNKSMPPQSVVDSIKHVAQSIKNDSVNKPSHYTDGQIEVIEYIDDKGFDYCIGNAIKYLSRAGKKQNEIEDLEKAVWYINHKIQKLKNG